MANVPAVTPDKVERLVELLSEGAYIHEAVKAVKLHRQRLHEYETKNPAAKQVIRAAIAFGARFRIDEAAQKADKAKTRDQALIARIAMEVARSRAELVAPAEYGKQALPTLPSGATAELTIKWAGDIAHQPTALASPNTAKQELTSSKVSDAAYEPVQASDGQIAHARDDGQASSDAVPKAALVDNFSHDDA